MPDDRTVEECRHCSCEWVCPECDGRPKPGAKPIPSNDPHDFFSCCKGPHTYHATCLASPAEDQLFTGEAVTFQINGETLQGKVHFISVIVRTGTDDNFTQWELTPSMLTRVDE